MGVTGTSFSGVFSGCYLVKLSTQLNRYHPGNTRCVTWVPSVTWSTVYSVCTSTISYKEKNFKMARLILWRHSTQNTTTVIFSWLLSYHPLSTKKYKYMHYLQSVLENVCNRHFIDWKRCKNIFARLALINFKLSLYSSAWITLLF